MTEEDLIKNKRIQYMTFPDLKNHAGVAVNVDGKIIGCMSYEDYHKALRCTERPRRLKWWQFKRKREIRAVIKANKKVDSISGGLK